MEKHYWFETTVSLDKVMDDGCTKKYQMKHLVDAMSFKEAEDRITKEIAPLTSGEFEVTAVKRVRIFEIVNKKEYANPLWYRVKLVLITIDENTGVEKEVPYVIMVLSSSIDNAIIDSRELMVGSLNEYRIVKVEETKIEDVFMYIPQS